MSNVQTHPLQIINEHDRFHLLCCLNNIDSHFPFICAYGCMESIVSILWIIVRVQIKARQHLLKVSDDNIYYFILTVFT